MIDESFPKVTFEDLNELLSLSTILFIHYPVCIIRISILPFSYFWKGADSNSKRSDHHRPKAIKEKLELKIIRKSLNISLQVRENCKIFIHLYVSHHPGPKSRSAILVCWRPSAGSGRGRSVQRCCDRRGLVIPNIYVQKT